MAKNRKDLEITVAKQSAEIKHLKAGRQADLVCTTISGAFRWGCFAFLGWCTLQAVRELAGKTTFAELVVGFLANVEVGWTVSLSVGFVGVLFGVKERKLRLRKTASMAVYIRQLEARLDPKRTTTTLTLDGQTNPEDKR
jgi:hypothetical protein